MESQELAELAEDSGLAETPSGGEGMIVARVDAASQIRRGEEGELWVDASKLHLFDPSSGLRLGAPG
jgi:multiple sugar transport system ATP-binding protein